MLKYDFKTQLFTQVDISSVTESKYEIFPGPMIDEKLYFICLSNKWGEGLRFALYNSEKNKVELFDQILADNYTGFPYVSGSKVFILDWWNLEVLKYKWYDTKTGEYINPITITLDEILEN